MQRRILYQLFLPLQLLVAVSGLAVTVGGCSLLVDDSRRQCRTDSDCFKFGGYPYCVQGVCAPSGLGPVGCVLGTPASQEDYGNACSMASCIPFDNCSRLSGCGGEVSTRGALIPPANLGTVPPLVNAQGTPEITCADPSRPNIIYVTGSTNFWPLAKAVQPLLSARNPPYTLVYQPQTSCRGAGTMFDPDRTRRTIKDIPGNWAGFYNEQGVRTYCRLNPDGDLIDVGQSDVFARTCGFEPVPNVGDYVGPIQAITFVVPAASSQTSISAEAAHYVFGAGGRQGGVPPWTDPNLFFVRSSGTGTIQLTSRAINVPAAAWWGIDRLSSDNLRDSMEGVDPTSAEKAIGVLSSDFADDARDNLRILSFQGFGQKCGYLPDSSPTSYDKSNVRDGHYPIWGPIHLYAPTTNGVPSPAADALVTRFSVPRLDQKLLEAVVQAGYIPSCAMRVRRDQEMGPLVSYQPSLGCGCYFDKLIGARSNCTECATSSDCPSDRKYCNYGFCEIQ